MKGDDGKFFEDVYEVVRLIPKGRVTSYGAIAAYLGAKSSARVVGWALNSSTMHDGVPAHRVVNKSGSLTGKHHFRGPNSMQDRLEREGIVVKDHVIQDLDKHFWDPMEELGL
ncbi:MGMT family protein [Fulvivirgaceae bacterium BMA10]|uniref:MGMT family protein n=1 Tax=Splendidivirga corallicola TaxID=3051826 RepID=A0ABT8KJT7_9BACT|nr:MGMT family protein [Fulvivirgaceae bacterium BMA10]